MKHVIERRGSRGEREQLNEFSGRPVRQTHGLNLASLCGDQLQNNWTKKTVQNAKRSPRPQPLLGVSDLGPGPWGTLGAFPKRVPCCAYIEIHMAQLK